MSDKFKGTKWQKMQDWSNIEKEIDTAEDIIEKIRCDEDVFSMQIVLSWLGRVLLFKILGQIILSCAIVFFVNAKAIFSNKAESLFYSSVKKINDQNIFAMLYKTNVV